MQKANNNEKNKRINCWVTGDNIMFVQYLLTNQMIIQSKHKLYSWPVSFVRVCCTLKTK